MKREYYIRGKQVTVEEIPGILAIRLEIKPERALSEVAKQFGRLATESPQNDEEVFTISEKEEGAFTGAGWVFVRPSETVARAAEAREAPEGASYIGRVFLQTDGHVLVGTDHLTVQLDPGLSEAEVESTLRDHDLEVIRQLKFAPNQYQVRVPKERDPLDVAVELHHHSAFVFAEPEMVEYIPSRFTPTDPDYNQQWFWNNDGTTGGTAGADVSAESAWDVTRGAGIRIAVIDHGIDVNHPDITAAVGTGAGYFAPAIPTPSFVLGTNNFPIRDHGTRCTGMAIARANNNEGGCGIANQTTLIPIACLSDAVGTQTTLARAIAYAADPNNEVINAQFPGADVISCSLGPSMGPGPGQQLVWNMTATLQNAIDFAINNGRGGLGTPVFWASANEDVPIDGPLGALNIRDEVAAYQNTIAVGRTDRNDTNTLNGGSAFGPELDFVAPGVRVYLPISNSQYDVDTGTSYATPCCAGIAALILSTAPNLIWDQIRQVMRDTCDKVGGVNYGVDGHHDRYGFGRVDAAIALCEASWIALGVQPVELLTPNLTFNDIPENASTVRAVVLSIRSCREFTFEIVEGPTVISGPPETSFTPLETMVVVEAVTAAPTPREARIWILYTGTNDGDSASGNVKIRCNETDEEWEIQITANTISKPNVASVLSLDKSGSMKWFSGIPGTKRIEVLKFSAPIFVNHLEDDDAIGIVSFNQDAYDIMPVTHVGPTPLTKATAISKIRDLTPGGNTAIGDAVEKAHDLLQPITGYDAKATIVLTDGDETASKYIADVMDLINERVYAIGLGTAEVIKPAALTALTNMTGGYLVMTDRLGPNDYLKLMKYFLQVLAGVTNADIILDPEGWLKPGQELRTPFQLTETDISCEVILLTVYPDAFKFFLETPEGQVIDPETASANPGVSYFVHDNEIFYRMTLPMLIEGREAREGTWHAVLAIEEEHYDKYLRIIGEGQIRHSTVEGEKGIVIPRIIEALKAVDIPQLVEAVLAQLHAAVHAHGVLYSLNVLAHSNLRMRASLAQNSYEPGASLTLRTRLTEYDHPVTARAKVHAVLIRPDNTETTLTLDEVEPGVFEASTLASMSGIYKFSVMGNGITLEGNTFSRQQLLTGSVWKGGDNPLPTGKDDPEERPSIYIEKCCRAIRRLLRIGLVLLAVMILIQLIIFITT